MSSTTNPEFPVDISIAGICIIQGESFGEIRGPFSGPAGTYAFNVSMANAANPCGNTPIFTANAPLSAATSYMGVLSEDASGHVTGQIFAIDLSTVPAGSSRIVVVNATPDNLTATLTGSGASGGTASATIAAGSVQSSFVPSGQYTGTVSLDGSSTAAVGPVTAELASRNVYLYLLAGSVANDSIQLVGPKVIRDVL